MRLVARWASAPVRDSQMRRMNLAFFMQLGSALDALSDFALMANPEQPQWPYKAAQAHQMLTSLMGGGIPLSIPASALEITGFLQTLERFRNTADAARTDDMGIWVQASKVKTLLEGELAIQAVYYVMPKRAYDTNRLIDHAANIFSEDIQAWLTPGELYDVQQGGRCLALEVPTAAGFHLIRAAESVIRRYVSAVTGSLPSPKMRSWGVYVRELRKCGADPKVVGAVEQVKDFHRNPVVHPEEQLSPEEAVSLLGIIESLIGAIYRDMIARDAKGQPLVAMMEVKTVAAIPAKAITKTSGSASS